MVTKCNLFRMQSRDEHGSLQAPEVKSLASQVSEVVGAG